MTEILSTDADLYMAVLTILKQGMVLYSLYDFH